MRSDFPGLPLIHGEISILLNNDRLRLADSEKFPRGFSLAVKSYIAGVIGGDDQDISKTLGDRSAPPRFSRYGFWEDPCCPYPSTQQWH